MHEALSAMRAADGEAACRASAWRARALLSQDGDVAVPAARGQRLQQFSGSSGGREAFAAFEEARAGDLHLLRRGDLLDDGRHVVVIGIAVADPEHAQRIGVFEPARRGAAAGTTEEGVFVISLNFLGFSVGGSVLRGLMVVAYQAPHGERAAPRRTSGRAGRADVAAVENELVMANAAAGAADVLSLSSVSWSEEVFELSRHGCGSRRGSTCVSTGITSFCHNTAPSTLVVLRHPRPAGAASAADRSNPPPNPNRAAGPCPRGCGPCCWDRRCS